MDGCIFVVNDNFLVVMGYCLEEVCGQYYLMFVEFVYCQSVEYQCFWEKLGWGEFDVG